MNLVKYIFFCTFLLSNFINYAQFTDQINSNRPGKSAGAFSVGKNIYQVESGIYGIKDSHSLLNYDATGFGLDFTARAGLLKEQLEFTLDAQFQFDSYSYLNTKSNRSGFKNTTFGAKYLFYDPFKKGEKKANIYSWKANHKFNWKHFIPALSGYVGVNYVMKNDYNLPNESVISPKIIIIAQNHFGTRWVLVTNIIADKITSETKNFGYIFTLTRGINEKWSAFFENRGIQGNYYSDGIFTIGATHLLKNNLQIDASISKNIKNTPSLLFGGVGVSWRFDKKHKDIKMENGKEVKEEKRKKNKAGNEPKSQEELAKEQEKANKKKKKKKEDVEQEELKEVPVKRIDQIEE